MRRWEKMRNKERGKRKCDDLVKLSVLASFPRKRDKVWQVY